MRQAWVSLLLIMTLLVTACAAKTPPTGGPGAAPAAAPQPEVTTITLAAEAADPRLDAVISAFQEKHTEYRVTRVPVTVSENLAPRIQAGEIDLVPIEHSVRPLTTKSLLADLMPFVQKSGFDLAPYGPLLEAGKADGKLWALPVYAHPNLLIYNQRLVQEAGVVLPAGGWTWDQFADTVRRLTKGTGDDKVWGFDPYTLSPQDLVYLRAKALAPDGPDPEVAAFRQSLGFFAGLRNDQAMARSIPFPAIGLGPLATYWDKGKAVFGVVPLTLFQYGRLPDAALAQFPADPGKRPSLLASASAYGIAANAAHPDAAWAFLSFLAGPEGAAILAGQGFLPAYASDAARQAWAANPATAGLAPLFDATWYLPPTVFDNPSPLYTMYEQASQVLSGTAAVDDAVAAYEGALGRQK